ncbi:mannose-1-phosphate guanylyltransferase/mannose-6-phosphate isomerase [Moritella sp. Urea-trap-13]|uniref:mannose-1-phosphate guanylyltransferase/mannose-6-phosphate isomerase n=1 Tax=Moritella sp. Urea-trap-13 TaxID=2058327 RepID=UPI000C335875|nr:mannose-1-phosphate guanylyltransferase/mannose-6-phosphate isomerase [Moritella sp. Urea-trap-13]PKH07918.1 mannose-1-phosphate guanylyltransferase/mannose-6-phosphate isomerase [Moritella sp. Urea-trap-13]
MILPVIMAGGNGCRLWPLSRELYPKQFLTVSGEQSMLQQTVARLTGLAHQLPLVICNEEHRFIAAEQLHLGGFKHSGIILEPVGRNTAPAIALAALQALKFAKNDEEPILLVLSSDHLIKNTAAFQSAVNKAIPFAEDGQLVTFGIVPTSPEIGYGYINAGAMKGDAFTVNKFVEKPNLETAQDYLDSGHYYWNSGMFLFKASRYIEELKLHHPDILTACEMSLAETKSDMGFIRINKAEFELCPNDSIDYAVMEKSDDVVVVPMDAGWSDVGSWSALWDIAVKDENNNVTKGDTLTVNTSNSYLYSENKLIAAVGIDNLVIVETKDAILVAHKDQVQHVRNIVSDLKRAGRTEHKIHREVYRPWGKYDSVDCGPRDQVKRITVKPGAKLSIQMHHHRAEHWVVVSGTAKVTNGDKTILLTENESTYIPIGQVHALENPGVFPLELIEVQSGSYLGEDDIIRFEDLYGRC